MIRLMQINLRRGREAQNLLMQVASEREVDILLISEQYRKPEMGTWFEDGTSKAVIVIRNKTLSIKDTGKQELGFVWVEVEGIHMYSCYFPPNERHDDFL